MSAIEILKTYFDAFNSGDLETLESLLHDDVEHHVNQGPIRPGKARFQEFNRHMSACYREELTDLVLFSNEDGTRAAAEFTVNGTYLKTDEGLPPAKGQRYVLPAGIFFTLKDRKIIRVATHYNLEDWMRQVVGTVSG